MGVEVSHDDYGITEVKNKMKVFCEIGGTAGYRGNVNVMNEHSCIIPASMAPFNQKNYFKPDSKQSSLCARQSMQSETSETFSCNTSLEKKSHRGWGGRGN